jgi:cytochrome c-type biogenesis protein CcmH
MIVIALVFLLRPLKLDSNQNDIDRTAQNISIAKDRFNELKLELEQGVINQQEYEQTQEELEQSLLNDVEQLPSENVSQDNSSSSNRVTQLALITGIPVIAISLYAYLGQPELIGASKKQAAVPAGHALMNGAGKLGTVEQMVEKLAVKMKEQPDNAEGWFMLGRSYMSLSRYKEAVAALEKTNLLVPNNPTVMLRYADALTMLRGGQISGKPFELIKRAVEIKPDDPTGLWLLGMGYDEQGEYSKAISYWTLLLPLLKDEKSINEVKNLVRKAKNKSGRNIADSSTLETRAMEKESTSDLNISSLKVAVSLDSKFNENVSKNDTVFIFAKAVNGPPMPLAIVRKQVKDLPLEVTLDDTMAMTPTMKLSNFNKVQVVARVSKSGSAKALSGDLQSEKHIASAIQKEKIELIINKLVQ